MVMEELNKPNFENGQIYPALIVGVWPGKKSKRLEDGSQEHLSGYDVLILIKGDNGVIKPREWFLYLEGNIYYHKSALSCLMHAVLNTEEDGQDLEKLVKLYGFNYYSNLVGVSLRVQIKRKDKGYCTINQLYPCTEQEPGLVLTKEELSSIPSIFWEVVAGKYITLDKTSGEEGRVIPGLSVYLNGVLINDSVPQKYLLYRELFSLLLEEYPNSRVRQQWLVEAIREGRVKDTSINSLSQELGLNRTDMSRSLGFRNFLEWMVSEGRASLVKEAGDCYLKGVCLKF